MCLALPGVPVHRIDARTSLAEIVAALNAYRPQYLSGYPSLISLLAIEQLEGRLKIAPGAVATGGEVRSEEMTANITAAWKVQPFNQYATTEGLFGSDCDHHTGIHVFEDYCLVEVVDADGRPRTRWGCR
jgi:phenylacetate-coenzyme A ligase PaaK-like adenylate-forming protein